jgi:hypothetical protein
VSDVVVGFWLIFLLKITKKGILTVQEILVEAKAEIPGIMRGISAPQMARQCS